MTREINYQNWSLPHFDFSLDSFSTDILSRFDKSIELPFPKDVGVETDNIRQTNLDNLIVQTASRDSYISSDDGASMDGEVGQILNKRFSAVRMLRKSSTFLKNKLFNRLSSTDITPRSKATRNSINVRRHSSFDPLSYTLRQPGHSSAPDLHVCIPASTDGASTTTESYIEYFEYQNGGHYIDRQMIMQSASKKKGAVFFKFC